MSLRQKASKGVVWSLFQAFGAQLSSTIVIFILARLLGAETFGLVALASIYIDFVQVILDQGFATAIIQRRDLEPEHLDTAFWLGVILSLAVSLLTFLLAREVAFLFKEPDLTNIIRWLSIVFIFRSFNSVQEALLRRDLNFKGIAVRTLSSNVAAGLTGIAMAYLGFGVWSLVGRQIIFAAVSVPLLWSASNWRPGLRISGKHFRELFGFGVHILGSKLATFFSMRSDDLLIGYFLGPTALGYYTIAYRLVQTTNRLLAVSGPVATSVFSKIQDDLERVRENFYRLTEYIGYLSFPIFIIMASLAPEIVYFIFGEGWSKSIPVLQILALYGIVRSLNQYNSTILISLGKPHWDFAIGGGYAIVNVATFVVAANWGIVAVAGAFTSTGYLLYPISYTAVNKLIGLSLPRYSRIIFKPLYPSLMIGLLIFFLRLVMPELSGKLGFLILSGLISFLVYAIYIFFFNQDLIDFVKTTFKVKNSKIQN